jgi:DNA-directed RNA polymerase subunit RPC12/RpoP|tara:strand:- start:2946 stop:3257 length:312 start_codon:yes stop_codon:yes gene_type:complete
MRCPACGTKFKSLSSWPLAAGRPVVCGNCGTASKRLGRWKPLLIAVALLFAFHQMIGMFALTLSGTILLLVGLILLSMTVDEATIQLVPIDGPAPDPEDAPKA